MKKYQTQRVMLYFEIKQLLQDNFKISQISKKLSISRTTVYFYSNMSEEAFLEWVKKIRKKAGKLSQYEERIKDRLKEHPELSGYQIHDWLLEHYGELKVSRRTVSGFVARLRELYNIPKPAREKLRREYEAVEDMPYGRQAQVDFGIYVMKDRHGEEVKIYFMVTVLSRSRYKHLYFQSRPFTTLDVIQGHEEVFGHYCGIPAELVYDQDKLIVVSENHGDLLFTEKFRAYLQLRKFETFVCRKSDPETKGKVENVVKYVKSNFLPARIYINDEVLNAEGLAWLKRTGNGQVHGTTKRIPAEDFLVEKEHLSSFSPISLSSFYYTEYHLRKDNLITYGSNRYSVPGGTYKGRGTKVWIKIEESWLIICTEQKEELIRHKISLDKGVTITNTDHKRDKSGKIKELLAQVAALFEDKELAEKYLLQLQKAKPRYIRDQLLLIKKTIDKKKITGIDQALAFCHSNRIYSARDFKAVLQKLNQDQAPEVIPLEGLLMNQVNPAHFSATPQKSQISDYESIVNSK